jgi:hypothetical protein
VPLKFFIKTTDPVLLCEASVKDSGGRPLPEGEREVNWGGKLRTSREEVGDFGFVKKVVHKAAPARPARKGIPMD